MPDPIDSAGFPNIDFEMLLEERVRERTAELRAVLETTREGFAAFRAGGFVTDVNEAYCRMIGYSREELLRMNVRDVDVAIDDSKMTQIGSRIRSQGAASFETRHRRKDGRVIDIEATLDWTEIGGGRYVAFMHDITERKRTEAVRARLLAILEATPDVVFTANLEGRIQYVNPPGRRLLGLLEDENPLIRECHPAWAWDLLRTEGLPATLRDGTWTGETALLSRDDREIPVLQVVIAHRDDTGAATYFSTVARDITEQKRAEEALRRQGETLQLAQRSAGAGAWHWDMASGQLDWSQELYGLFGLDPDRDRASFDAWRRVMHPDDREEAARRIDVAIKQRVPIDSDSRIVLPGGQVRWIRALGSAVYDPAGRPVRMAGICLDITERKTAEKSLRIKEAAIASTINGIAISDLDGRLTYVNDAFVRLWGYETADEILGMTRFDYWQDPKSVAPLAEALAERGHWVGELLGRRKNGSTFRAQVVTSRVDDESGRPICLLASFLDITESKAAEEKLQRSRDDLAAAVRELERASRAKDEFLASMSHELRTPLNGVLGMAEVLRSGIHGPLNERQQHCLQVVDEGGRHLLSLINDILDVAKIEAGRLVLQPEPCSVFGMCRASVAMVQTAAGRKQIDLNVEVDPEATPVTADPRRLQQILFNLLSNAVKFTPSGGRVSLEARVDPERREIRFTVSDTGPGIAAEDFRKLFKPFTQLDARLARQHGGTGLGLALVRHMTELHGGRVDVESEPGKGSRFTVFLPWVPRAEGSPPGTALYPIRAELSRPSPKPSGIAPVVLLVDDDPAAEEVLSSYLGASGIRLEVAKTGPQGLEMVASVHPDVVLMDIQLPGMDGLEVIRLLKAEGDGKGPRVIALTALAMTGDRERILAAGADDYMSKPVALQTLEARIRELAAGGASPGR